jgi:hypothetical protein
MQVVWPHSAHARVHDVQVAGSGSGGLLLLTLQVLLQWFAANKNKSGEQAVREAGKALFEPEGEPSAK